MLTVTLEPAENGIIKTIIDDNSNGAGDVYESKKIYELEKDADRSYSNTLKFLGELLDDLGIDTGNVHSKLSIVVGLDWGKKYIPSDKEVKDKIKRLKDNIKTLELTYLKPV